jgi:AcrR family transcriptional regulator
MHVYNCGVAPPLNKHQQKTEETRRKLLAAALRIFARDGFERSRLEDIAAEAGYTRGAFYANFATKEDRNHRSADFKARSRGPPQSDA